MVRVAEVRLRGHTGPLQARAYWPARGAGALLVFFPGSPADNTADQASELCSALGVVVLAPVSRRLADAITALEWAGDHAGELGADPAQLLIAGAGAGASLAAAAERYATEHGWPAVTRIFIPHSSEGNLNDRVKPPR